MVHHYFVVLSTIAALWLAAMVAPGPDFLLITRLSIAHGRRTALRAALGIATGVATWGTAGFFGIHALFVASPWLYLALKVGGGAYLLFLGVRLFAGSWKPAAPEAAEARPNREIRAFRLGLLTNIANPKAPLFVSSLFAATMPHHAPAMLGVAAICLMFAIAVGWLGLVARFLTIRRFADAFMRGRRWIDRVAGLAFMGFGTKLVLDRS
ncbi:LysE family translocator [Acidisoma cladoniae]|uniref:LysE family translocator n=1 Tax=Acidisoma cladoniae TaxID=3040935 RepID=UPI00254C3467|nr:LysE family transporter [Acidisoma sp. PAMC 29798]